MITHHVRSVRLWCLRPPSPSLRVASPPRVPYGGSLTRSMASQALVVAQRCFKPSTTHPFFGILPSWLRSPIPECISASPACPDVVSQVLVTRSMAPQALAVVRECLKPLIPEDGYWLSEAVTVAFDVGEGMSGTCHTQSSLRCRLSCIIAADLPFRRVGDSF